MPVPLQNPSSIQVTGPASFAANFAENAQNVVCEGAFGAGAYAVGASLLGSPLPKPPQALLLGGAVVAAMSLCPSRPTQEGILGTPSPFSGGQCAVRYNFEGSTNSYQSSSGSPGGRPIRVQNILGPVSVQNGLKDGLQPEGSPLQALRFVGADGTVFDGIFESYGHVPGSLTGSFSRLDGLPDNCGNPGNSGGTFIQNSTTGDTVNTTNVIDNSSQVYIAPIVFNLPSFQGTINMPFSNVRIGSLLPLNFDIDIGGLRFGFGQNPDGVLVPREVRPDLEEPADDRELLRKIQKGLADIRECVCKPEVEMDMLFVPLLQESADCELATETLLVPKGSVSPSLFDKFVRTAMFGVKGCQGETPEQLPQSLIYAASTTQDGRELFTPKFGVEVVSLILKITEIRPDGPGKISLYPASNQRKFGSVSYVLATVDGGGDYVYVFDTETYLPLPRRTKPGKLRLLLKKGLSFEVYDSGERL